MSIDLALLHNKKVNVDINSNGDENEDNFGRNTG